MKVLVMSCNITITNTLQCITLKCDEKVLKKYYEFITLYVCKQISEL